MEKGTKAKLEETYSRLSKTEADLVQSRFEQEALKKNRDALVRSNPSSPSLPLHLLLVHLLVRVSFCDVFSLMILKISLLSMHFAVLIGDLMLGCRERYSVQGAR